VKIAHEKYITSEIFGMYVIMYERKNGAMFLYISNILQINKSFDNGKKSRWNLTFIKRDHQVLNYSHKSNRWNMDFTCVW
jgi:hypothetical protein